MKQLILTIAISLFLVGCASQQIEDPLAEFHETKPHSILVLPVVNKSVDVMADTSVLTTLPKILGERGFYVFPVNTVKTLMEFEGVSEAQEIHDKPPENLAQLFGADSILYVTIHSWTAKYLVLKTTTEVDLEYVIKDSNGNILFKEREKLSYSPKSDSSGNLFADLIVSAITAAVERAAPNYLPLTREANARVFYGGYYYLPPGPYHPEYENYYLSISEAQKEK